MSEDFKYTYSLKQGGEMFVIRANSLDEIFQDREELTDTLAVEILTENPQPPKEGDGKASEPIAVRVKRPYKHEGDTCPACGGTLQRKQGENSTTHAPFDFLGCSNFPTCEFTAYLSKFPKKTK